MGTLAWGGACRTTHTKPCGGCVSARGSVHKRCLDCGDLSVVGSELFIQEPACVDRHERILARLQSF